MPRIAISYRRADSAAICGRIFDRLTQRYGPGSVFIDIDEIPFGIDFRDHIAQVLSTCDAVIAVIGERWLGAEDSPRRIDQSTDPVRLEIQAALERKVPLIPVLVEGARMPEARDLPEPLQPLAFRNACSVDSGRDFHAHVDRLIRSIDRMFPATSPCSAAPAAQPTAPPPSSGPGPSAPAPARTPAAAPELGPARSAALVGLLALPQLTQFSQQTPLFLVALFVSVVGTAILLDREDRPTTARVATAAATICLGSVLQGSFGVLRASLLTW